MNTDTAPQIESPPPVKSSRTPALLRWAVRITSIPILALVLISLVPALLAFNIAARDDKVIALGLSGVCLGFLTAWKWPGIGGAISLLGVGVILAQEQTALGDPFSIAFAMQAVLFLISAVLGFQPAQQTATAPLWLKRAAIPLLATCAVAGAVMIYRGPGATPVPKEKARYIGTWDNNAGFRIDITASGEARVTQDKEAKVDPWNTPIKPGETKTFNAAFQSDDRLELTSGTLGEAKLYHIDRRPHPESKQIKMTLNGSDPYKRGSGIVLTKKPSSS